MHSTKPFTSQCLRDNSNCLGTTELPRTFGEEIQDRPVQLQAQNPCKFPFITKKKEYRSCKVRKKYPGKYWCATTVNSTNHKTSWGYCSDLCSHEANLLLKPGVVAVKSWMIELIFGILCGILLIVAFIIGYRCIRKKKVTTEESGKYFISLDI